VTATQSLSRALGGLATCASHTHPTLKLQGGGEGAPVSFPGCLGLCSPCMWDILVTYLDHQMTFIEYLLCTL
jgi:hypothetical protein